MKKLEQLYEGKAKKVFKTEDPDILIVDYNRQLAEQAGSEIKTVVSMYPKFAAEITAMVEEAEQVLGG